MDLLKCFQVCHETSARPTIDDGGGSLHGGQLQHKINPSDISSCSGVKSIGERRSSWMPAQSLLADILTAHNVLFISYLEDRPIPVKDTYLGRARRRETHA